MSFISKNHYDLGGSKVIKVKHNKHIISFNIDPMDSLEELMDIYCQRQMINPKQMRFSHNNIILSKDDIAMNIKNGIIYSNLVV